MKECLLCGQFFAEKIDLLELFLPFKKEHHLCQNCFKKFRALKKPNCPFCQKESEQADLCGDCKIWKQKYQGKLMKHHALFRYNNASHDLMVSYKRYGDFCLRKVLQELIGDYFKKNNEYDFYVPIPTSPEHMKKRRYDTIAGIFADLLPLTNCLEKRAGAGAQGEKNRAERLAAPQGFLIDKETAFKDNKSHSRILLLDDIYTTGRTLYHARDKLLEVAPSAQIESFSIYR